MVGVGASPYLLATGWAAPVALPRPTAALFRPHVSSTFAVASAGTRSVLALAKVTEEPPSSRVEQFSLVLHGEAAVPLPDGIYNFQHPVLGSMDLFINKVGSSDPLRARYQACFGYVRT